MMLEEEKQSVKPVLGMKCWQLHFISLIVSEYSGVWSVLFLVISSSHHRRIYGGFPYTNPQDESVHVKIA